jgi:elongation factor P
MCIEFKGKPHTIISFQHVKPGKGNAFVRTKLKNIVSKRIAENTFNAGAKINPIRIEQHICQYLYKDNLYFYFMDQKSFENIPLPLEAVAQAAFLKEGERVDILIRTDTEEPLTCELPATLWLKVTHTDLGAKGNTATKATKPATLETGAIIQVPLFINTDDIVKVDTTTGDYLAREKAA